MDVEYPFQIDGRGQVASAAYLNHVRQMIEQVLFTMEGERVNRPDFGCGLARMVFELSTSEVVAATQAMVQGALQRWLGELIRVQGVSVSAVESTLTVTVRFILQSTGQAFLEQFIR